MASPRPGRRRTERPCEEAGGTGRVGQARYRLQAGQGEERSVPYEVAEGKQYGCEAGRVPVPSGAQRPEAPAEQCITGLVPDRPGFAPLSTTVAVPISSTKDRPALLDCWAKTAETISTRADEQLEVLETACCQPRGARAAAGRGSAS